MKKKLIAREILIIYSSTLFNTSFDEENEQSITNETLADACRQGLLYEMIPEIWSKLNLKEINETNSFLELKYGNFNKAFDKELSINPYLFFQNKSEN